MESHHFHNHPQLTLMQQPVGGPLPTVVASCRLSDAAQQPRTTPLVRRSRQQVMSPNLSKYYKAWSEDYGWGPNCCARCELLHRAARIMLSGTAAASRNCFFCRDLLCGLWVTKLSTDCAFAVKSPTTTLHRAAVINVI